MPREHDVIVVGARCAGSAIALNLARRGYRVLVVDRTTFPSDTVSTHVLHPLGAAALERWGLLDRLRATGCPPISEYLFDFGGVAISGAPGTLDAPVAFCPRRTILDALLVGAAAEAGAAVREGFTVEGLIRENGRVVGVTGRLRNGTAATERATVVVGADGRFSIVAQTVAPEQYNEVPRLLAIYYSYWSGLPLQRFETYVRPRRGFAAAPTHDGLTLIVGGWPHAEFEANRKEIERHFTGMFDLAPPFAERVRRARREAPFSGAVVPGYFRKPYGDGWALVGDAGYNRDPITAQGIMDAFRDAERCAAALDEVLGGRRPFGEAMADYQRDRDRRVLPMYGFTCEIARLEPPSLAMQRLLASIQGNQPAMDAFVQMNAGTISPADFDRAVAAASGPA